MKKLLALLPLLAASASATPCTSTQYDMLNWFVMGLSWSQQYHLESVMPIRSIPIAAAECSTGSREPRDIRGMSITTTTVTSISGPPSISGMIPPVIRHSIAPQRCPGRPDAWISLPQASTARSWRQSRYRRRHTQSMAAAARQAPLQLQQLPIQRDF
jgi:hypothetical protein